MRMRRRRRAYLPSFPCRRSVEDLSEDVNSLDIQHMTALHYAAKRGFTQIVSYLHDKRADLEVTPTCIARLSPRAQIKNGVGQTALTIACQANQVEAVEELLRRGANAQAQEDLGITPLHRLRRTGEVKCLTCRQSMPHRKRAPGPNPDQSEG
eukprot:761772-Hanusia_phi.AAC.4